MSRYLFAYDICCPRRLRQIARALEQVADRVQKSVFLSEMSFVDVRETMEKLLELSDATVDRVQVWRLANDQPDEGLWFGHLASVTPACLIQDRARVQSIKPTLSP